MMGTGRLFWVGLAAAGFAAASVLFFGLALGFDPMVGTELVDRILETDTGDADALMWGAVFDMFGYYFLPAVVMIALRARLRWPSRLTADLATAGGLAYAVVGATGAAILAAAAPPLIEQGNTGALETVARTVEGTWQWFEPVPFAAWAVGVALALRAGSSSLSGLFWLLSSGAALVLLGQVLDVTFLLAVGLTVWLPVLPLAVVLVARRPELSQD
jgi:hypothetical protein